MTDASEPAILPYGHPATSIERIGTFLRRPMIVLPLALCIGLMILSGMDRHGMEIFDLRLRRLNLVMLSSRDQLCVSIQDEYQPMTIGSFVGRPPPGTAPMPGWSHVHYDEAGAPERDDYSTYDITMYYHPFIDQGNGWRRARGLKTFQINRPFGPRNIFQYFGGGVILPKWWVALVLLTPTFLWLCVLAARKLTARRQQI